MKKIISHKDLKVYQLSFEAAMQIFEISKSFPSEEKYSLTDQIRRSSRSVSGNIAEGWRKRRYEKSFVAKLSDSEGEAAETQVWLDYAFSCKYINADLFNEIYAKYDHILAMLVKMISNPQQWTLNKN
jgi:four helix bundle protein